MRPFLAAYLGGETPSPVRRLQHLRQVRGAPRPGPPPVRLRGRGDRPLRAHATRTADGAGAGCSAPATPTRTRPTSSTGSARTSSATPASRSASSTKPEVRAVARSLGLATADKPESQEICFVPGGDYRDALRTRAAGRRHPDRWSTPTATRLGEHGGAAGYTVGQRRGLGVALGEPRYVSRIDAATNTIVLGRRKDLETTTIDLDDVSFVAGPPTGRRVRRAVPGARSGSATARSRSRPRSTRRRRASRIAAAAGRPRRIGRSGRRPPGQAAVLYDGDVVLGGGRIARA